MDKHSAKLYLTLENLKQVSLNLIYSFIKYIYAIEFIYIYSSIILIK
jgi:hypothetical protein